MHRLRQVVIFADPQPLELFCGLLTLLTGIYYLFTPGTTLISMSGLAPPLVWTVAFLTGISQMVSVTTNGRFRALSLGGIGLWTLITAADCTISPKSYGVALFGLVTLGQAWAYIRVHAAR